MTWRELQRALAALNYNVGPIDGIPGAQTRNALRQFQEINGLRVTGLVDPVTSARLAAKAAGKVESAAVLNDALGNFPSASVPPWLVIARANAGVAEIVGARHSPVIMGWIQRLGAKALGIEVRDDETPWCGTFMAMCVAAALDAEPIPVPAVRASAWDTFGVRLTTPALGAIIRVERPGGGHVGTYEGEDATHIHVLGGNTGNKVGTARIEKDRVRAMRWPSTYPLPAAGRVLLTPNGVPISTNEA